MVRHVNLCLLDPFYRFQQYLKYVVILNVMKYMFIGFCVKRAAETHKLVLSINSLMPSDAYMRR